MVTHQSQIYYFNAELDEFIFWKPLHWYLVHVVLFLKATVAFDYILRQNHDFILQDFDNRSRLKVVEDMTVTTCVKCKMCVCEITVQCYTMDTPCKMIKLTKTTKVKKYIFMYMLITYSYMKHFKTGMHIAVNMWLSLHSVTSEPKGCFH